MAFGLEKEEEESEANTLIYFGIDAVFFVLRQPVFCIINQQSKSPGKDLIFSREERG